MKNVVLLGDSIRATYDKSVKKSLDGIANVVFPDENCRFAAFLLRYFNDFLCGIKGEDIDVLHWNAGLWDCLQLYDEGPQTPIEMYEYYIERLCMRIKNACPNAKVIFATSTSIIEANDGVRNFKRYNKDICEYNKVAVKIVKKYGFEVNDLHKLSLTMPEDSHSDGTHYYTPEGTEAFSKQVLDCIAPALGLDEVPDYAEVLHTAKPVGV